MCCASMKTWKIEDPEQECDVEPADLEADDMTEAFELEALPHKHHRVTSNVKIAAPANREQEPAAKRASKAELARHTRTKQRRQQQ